MSRLSVLRHLDDALGGQVSALLVRRRAEGRSVSEIRDELRDEHHITVSVRTVRRWLASLSERVA